MMHMPIYYGDPNNKEVEDLVKKVQIMDEMAQPAKNKHILLFDRHLNWLYVARATISQRS